MKIKKKQFEEKIVDAYKNIPRHYEQSCIRLAYNNLLLSLDNENLY
jgi:hypothetical protein